MADAPRILALIIAAGMLATPAHAQKLHEVESDLATTKEALESATAERKALQRRNTKLRKELGTLQQDLVDITEKVKRQEKLLSELEGNLLNLQDEEREKAARLLRSRREQGQMVQTILKLSKVPPEMVVAMPGDFENTMRTAKVLGLTTKALSHQATQISTELAEIHALQSQIKQNHRKITRQKTTLQRHESILASKLDTRSEIQSKLLSRYNEQKQQVASLSKQSNTLKELMSQLEQRHGQAEKKAEKLAMVPSFKPEPEPEPQGKATLSADSRADFAAAKGKISLPAEGKIFIFYGDATKNGDDSRGISLRTRSGAKVTSPYGGEVVYTGTFLDYGNMVIVRHEENYHSLLAGMDTVSAKLGQQVIKGEPIGEMGRNEDKTALYMEIRKDNRPIDPIPWLEAQQYANKR